MLQPSSASRGLANVYTIPGLAGTLGKIGFPLQVMISAAAGQLLVGNTNPLITCNIDLVVLPNEIGAEVQL